MAQAGRGAKAKLVRRLRWYWRLEALNALLVPAFAVFLIVEGGDAVSWPVMVAMAAAALLLVVGAAAWRTELHALEGRPAFGRRVLPLLAAMQPVSLLLVLGSAGAAAYEVVRDGAWSPSALGATILAVLAGLEYINYYVMQLQHFDHAPDFARLLKGRGFREAHLAGALRRWRSARRS